MEELTRLKKECEVICQTLYKKRNGIFENIEALEKEREQRQLKKKEIMLREMKRVLALLNETEKNLIHELKADAMDKVNILTRLSENSRELRDEIGISELKEDSGNILRWKEHLRALKKKIADVDSDFLESCLALEVHTTKSSVEYEALRCQYRDLVYHTAGSLNPKNFVASLDRLSVVTPGKLQFSIFHAEKAVLKHEFILDKLKITVSGPSKSPDGQGIVYEESSVLDMIKTRRAVLVEEPQTQSQVGQILVTVKQQKFPMEICVKLFDCNIVGSPRGGEIPLAVEGTENASIAFFDADLDESDYRSLDVTGRRARQHPGSSHWQTKSSSLAEIEEEKEEKSDVVKTRPQLVEGRAPKSILKYPIVMDPPDSASNSPFNPKFKGTLKVPLPEQIEQAIVQLSQGADQVGGNLEKTRSVELEDDDDPHLHLNESKAPSPTALKKTILQDDWEEEGEAGLDHNVSVLPDMVSHMDQSLWQEQEIVRFNFSIGQLKEEATLDPKPITVSSSRGVNLCLECPDSVAVLPSLHLLMVSEPQRDRIGLFQLNNLQFCGWFQFPSFKMGSKTNFHKPSSLLVMDDILVIIDSEQLFVFHITGRKCSLVFQKFGSFNGLTSSSMKELSTISKEGQKMFLVSFKSLSRVDEWKMTRKIQLASTESNIRFLTRGNERFYMTNRDSHHLILLDLEAEQIREGGYFGHKAGQMYQPGGLILDDVGNILICDSGNNKLVLYNERMQYIKDIGEPYQRRPHSVLRHGNFVYVVFQDEDRPAVIRYKLTVAGLESEETSPDVSVTD